jgi:hypothetical protein
MFLQEWCKTGVINQLVGFENNSKDGTGYHFNFILSNGARSKQRDVESTDFTFMIPADAFEKIRSVTIHYYSCIVGFSFFDKDGALLWKHGNTASRTNKEKVVLEENEVIVGVVAKLHEHLSAAYTDF